MSRARVQVVGLSEALRHIRTYEKSMYKEVTSQMRTSAQPLAQQVGGEFPDRVLTNWNGKLPAKRRKTGRPFPGYDAAAARGGVKPKVGIGRVRNNERNILRVQQMTAGGAVFDSAGSRSNNIFIRNLDTYAPTGGRSRKGVSRSRVMYKAVERRMPMVETIVARSIAVTDKIVQQAINARGKA